MLTLGPVELADAVTVRYIDPPPLYMNVIRYGLYGATGLTGLLAFWIVGLQWPKITIKPLPESVQGPVLVTAEGAQGREALNELPNIAHREKKRLQEYSPYLPKAVVAAEDSRFYWHIGVDPWGIARALKTNIADGAIREGASTLTQQMARNTYRDYVGTEDSAQRKIREAVVALKLACERRQVMKVYLAIVRGAFEDARRVVDLPLGPKGEGLHLLMSVREDGALTRDQRGMLDALQAVCD